MDASIDQPFKLSGQLFPGSGILREVLANDAVNETYHLLRHHHRADWATRLAPYPEAAEWPEH